MRNERRVAVTGIGIICSLGNNRYEVIKAMKDGKVGVSIIEQFSTEKLLTHIGAELKTYKEEDYFTAEELNTLDKTGCLGIVAAKEAISDSGIDPSCNNLGLAFGTCNGGIRSIENYNSIDEIPNDNFLKYTFFGQTDAIAKYFGINGPVNTINSACAASGSAIGYASDMIKNGYTDIMLAGGADAMSLSVYAGFNSLKALSEEPCSPYSTKTGLTLGEGSAFVILEELKKARSRKAQIYAEVCGYGLSNDGFHATAPDPNGLGIKHAVNMAVKCADIPKEKIGYINTHGTGTQANDKAELMGMRQYFGDGFDNIYVSSSKAYFGHNLGAGAAIEYTTSLLAMKEGLLPATMNFEQAREDCNYKNIITNEMIKTHVPEYFLKNNAAFGGHNCSIVSRLEPYINDCEDRKQTKKSRVVIIGAGSILDSEYTKGPINKFFEINGENGGFSLKDYNKDLYVRRMNKLSQMSIAATDLALNDSKMDKDNLNPYDVGMCFGTSKGSLDSARKYLESIFNKGTENASSIYFPDMVLNSTAGVVSRIMKIKGYASSSSSGGNEGILALLNAYHVLRDNIQKYCLAVVGDEKSSLAEKIYNAYGFENCKYKLIEGATAMVLTSYENAINEDKRIYAEILGFGMSNSDDMKSAMDQAISNANISEEDICVVFYNSSSLNEDFTIIKEKINISLNTQVPIISGNEKFGYAESISSLNQVSLALDMLGDNNEECKKAMIISRSWAGNLVILIISK